MTQAVSISLADMWAIAQATYNDNPTRENAQVKLDIENRLLEKIK